MIHNNCIAKFWTVHGDKTLHSVTVQAFSGSSTRQMYVGHGGRLTDKSEEPSVGFVDEQVFVGEQISRPPPPDLVTSSAGAPRTETGQGR